MNGNESFDEITDLHVAEEKLMQLRRKVSELRAGTGPLTVSDYSFRDKQNKEVTLASFFGDKQDLIVVHNMGKSCRYCTLWADGFNGMRQHLENRAAFVVVSPDKPEVMKEFSEGRGWKFRILSTDGGSFSKDMGYENDAGSPLPGISTFHRDDQGIISRIAHAPFGPGDEFCAVWHIFDMLKAGPDRWEPQYSY